MALKAVVFDVGETLVDEERWWRRLADREGLQPHVVWAALGVTIERGEEHTALWGHLGIEQPPRWWSEIPYALEDLYPDALGCLERVGALGLRVGIVGNQSKTLEAWARESALPADVISSSASLGRSQARPCVLLQGGRVDGERRVGGRLRRGSCRQRRAARCVSRAGCRPCPPWPWGRLQRTPAEATLGVDDLASLPEALASLR